MFRMTVCSISLDNLVKTKIDVEQLEVHPEHQGSLWLNAEETKQHADQKKKPWHGKELLEEDIIANTKPDKKTTVRAVWGASTEEPEPLEQASELWVNFKCIYSDKKKEGNI